MMTWDRKMTNKLTSLNLRSELLLRYVDDVNIVLRIAKTFKSHLNLPLDQIVAEEVLKIADSISPMLKFEADYPSNNLNSKLPILDLACWVQNNLVLTTFYKKPMASSSVISPNSTFSPKVVRNIILQEAIRRLTNCSPSLEV